MRKYQLEMKLSIFDGSRSVEEGKDLVVYTDGNDIWGVICAGFHEMIDVLVKTGRCRPIAFGAKESGWR